MASTVQKINSKRQLLADRNTNKFITNLIKIACYSPRFLFS